MKNEKTREFADVLRRTTLPQGVGYLAQWDSDADEWQFCCLGVGCEHLTVESDEPEESTFRYYGRNGVYELPPPEFFVALGFDEEEAYESGQSDLVIDWPSDLTNRLGTAYWTDTHTRTCAGLNDSGEFTFAQIGDLIDYFGVTMEAE